MPSITGSVEIVSRNGGPVIPPIPGSTGRLTLSPCSETGKDSAGETGSATCRIL